MITPLNSIIVEDLENIYQENIPWKNLEGKTILISGAGGLLASYMVYMLCYLNNNKFTKPCTILCLVRDEKKAQAKLGVDLHMKFIIQDVTEPVLYNNPIHFIIHAASKASPIYYRTDPIGVIEANVTGTKNLLQLADEKKVESFLFISSGEVYGEVSSEYIPTKENDFGYIDITNVRSCYAESKRLGETMCVSWFSQKQVPAKIVRPFHTYGPGIMLDDGRVFADFIKNIIHNEDIELSSDGSATRAFCYIADAIAGFFTILLRGEDGQAYNIGDENNEISIKELATTLINLFPEKKLQLKQKLIDQNYVPSVISRNCPNTNKARMLGWKPKISIKDGFYRTISSFNLKDH